MRRHAPSIGIGIGISLRSDSLGAPGLLDLFPGAAFATAHIALARNWRSNDVDEVRRSSDSDTESFTAGQILNGQMLDFVNNPVDLGTDDASADNTADWDMTDATIAHSSDKYVVTWTADTQWAVYNNGALAEQNQTLSYTVDVKSGTGGDVAVYAGMSGTGNVTLLQIGTSSSEWQTLTFDGQNSASSGNDMASIRFDLTSGNIEFKNFQAIQTTAGGFVSAEYDQSGSTVRDATQATTTEQPKIVDAGAVVLDGNGNVSTLWDGVDDDLNVIAGFAGLTSANVYTVTDNAGVVTIDTLTAQDISSATNLSTILTSLTYDKVTSVIIYPDATDQAGIEAKLSDLFE